MKFVEIKNNLFYIQFSSSDRNEFFTILEGIKGLFGRRFHSERNPKIWTAPITKENIGKLKSLNFVIPEIEIKKELEIELKHEFAEIDESILTGLYPYQILGVRFLEFRRGNGLLSDTMGLGKTIQALGYLKLHPELRPALVICPAGIKINWMREINKWLGENVDIFNGKKPYDLFYFISCNIFIINYDILSGWEEKLLEKEWAVIISDECHNLSNWAAKRTKSFRNIIKKNKKCKRIFLSGTPIKNRTKEFFTVLNSLDSVNFGNRYQFLKDFCSVSYDPFNQYNENNRSEELYKMIFPLMLRREKKDVLSELPEKQKAIISLECSGTELQNYRDASIEFLIWVENNINNKKEIQNRLEYLKQLAYVAKRNSLIQWIKDFLESSEDKLVLFGIHRKAIDDLFYMFQNISVKVYGGMTINERQRSIDQFQEDQKIRLFIGQIKAAGEGINLTSAHYVGHIEIAWNPATHEQATDRTHRIGQDKEVIAYYFVALNTIEDHLISILQEKYGVIRKILDGTSDESFFNSPLLGGLIEGIRNDSQRKN